MEHAPPALQVVDSDEEMQEKKDTHPIDHKDPIVVKFMRQS